MYKQNARAPHVLAPQSWTVCLASGTRLTMLVFGVTSAILEETGGQMGWMPTGRRALFVLLFVAGGVISPLHAAPARWSEAKAQEWNAAQPWLVGANFIPADAINQLEMWQAESFDPAEIDKELGWAEGWA
jgi:hypothetical protein